MQKRTAVTVFFVFFILSVIGELFLLLLVSLAGPVKHLQTILIITNAI